MAARSPRRPARRLELLARGRRLPAGRRRALVPEELLIRIGPSFEPLFWIAVAVWIFLSAGALATHASREKRRRSLDSLREALRRGTDPGTLSPKALFVLSADPATPAQEARPLARRALESELGPGILRDAASARPWWRRIAALRVLTRSGDERAPELLRRALFSGHKPLAGAAAALLAQDASRRAAEVLVEGLISDVYSSSRLATALEQNGSPVGDLLRPRLRDSDSRLRYWAAYLAARWPRADGLDAELAALVTDPDPLVRKAAIQSLASLGGPLVEGAAARLRNDPIDFVRTHAVRALESGR